MITNDQSSNYFGTYPVRKLMMLDKTGHYHLTGKRQTTVKREILVVATVVAEDDVRSSNPVMSVVI